MRREEMPDDIQPDAELGAALRGLDEPPMDAVDWAAMRRSIGERAELPLARRRRHGRRRVLLPLAAAASVAMAAWIGWGGGAGETRTATAEELLRAEVSEQEFRHLVSQRSDADELLMIAIGEG